MAVVVFVADITFKGEGLVGQNQNYCYANVTLTNKNKLHCLISYTNNERDNIFGDRKQARSQYCVCLDAIKGCQ